MSRLNSEEGRLTISQENKLKRRPSSLGDYLNSGKYLPRSASTQSRVFSFEEDAAEDQVGGALSLPTISAKDTSALRYGLGEPHKSTPPTAQTLYVLKSNPSMPSLTVTREVVPFTVAKSPQTPLNPVLIPQKTMSEKSPWLSPHAVRHPVSRSHAQQ